MGDSEDFSVQSTLRVHSESTRSPFTGNHRGRDLKLGNAIFSHQDSQNISKRSVDGTKIKTEGNHYMFEEWITIAEAADLMVILWSVSLKCSFSAGSAKIPKFQIAVCPTYRITQDRAVASRSYQGATKGMPVRCQVDDGSMAGPWRVHDRSIRWASRIGSDLRESKKWVEKRIL